MFKVNNILSARGYIHLLVYTLLLLTTISVNAKCGYYKNYEDFVADRYEPLDTLYSLKNGQGRKLWFGSNDYRLTTGNDSIDSMLKKKAFAIKKDNELYVNCRKLIHKKVRFKNGYARAWRSDNNDIIFINGATGKEAQLWQTSSQMLAGSGSNFTYSSNQIRHRVCYIIPDGNNGKKYIEANLIDDAQMDKLIYGHDDLHIEYYSEERMSDRLLAKHVFPILEKAGVIVQNE